MILKLILIFLLFNLMSINCKQSANKIIKPLKTEVAFVVQQQKQGQNEVIQFVLQMKQSDPSLLDAMDKARELELQIREIYYQFCIKHNQRADEDWCENHIDADQYQIQSEYYQLRGQQLFKTNVIRFQMTFTVTAFKHIGTLIDQFEELMEESLVILKSIKWEDLHEENPQDDIMKRGLERAKTSCKSLGMRFDHIKSVTIVEQEEEEEEKPKPKADEGEEDEQQQEQQEEEQQQQGDKGEQLEKYKFVIVCKSKPPKPKVKSSKKISKEAVKNKVKNQKPKQASKKSVKQDKEL